VQTHITALVGDERPTGKLGEVFFPLLETEGDKLRNLPQRELEKLLITFLAPVEEILQYKFQDPFLLLEAFTHKSFKEYHDLSVTYEKLEVLGDTILDYLANSNLIKYTILEKYNVKERLAQTHITDEDF
jgi:hypothetical protein